MCCRTERRNKHTAWLLGVIADSAIVQLAASQHPSLITHAHHCLREALERV